MNTFCSVVVVIYTLSFILTHKKYYTHSLTECVRCFDTFLFFSSSVCCFYFYILLFWQTISLIQSLNRMLYDTSVYCANTINKIMNDFDCYSTENVSTTKHLFDDIRLFFFSLLQSHNELCAINMTFVSIFGVFLCRKISLYLALGNVYLQFLEMSAPLYDTQRLLLFLCVRKQMMELTFLISIGVAHCRTTHYSNSILLGNWTNKIQFVTAESKQKCKWPIDISTRSTSSMTLFIEPINFYSFT